MLVSIDQATPAELQILVAMADGKEVVLFDDFFRSNGQRLGYEMTVIDRLLAQQEGLRGQWVELLPISSESSAARKVRPLPSMDGNLVLDLMAKHGIGVRQIGIRTWQARFEHEDGAAVSNGLHPKEAVLRAYAKARLGETVTLGTQLAAEAVRVRRNTLA